MKRPFKICWICTGRLTEKADLKAFVHVRCYSKHVIGQTELKFPQPK